MITGEQQHIEFSTSPSGATSSEYYFYNIFASSIGGDGELKWMVKLPKRQYGRAYNNMSYKYLEINGDLYFFYKDVIENAKISSTLVPEEYKNGKPGILTVYKVNNTDGSVHKSFLADFDNINVPGKKGGISVGQFRTSRIFKISNGAGVEVYKGKKQDVLINIEVD